MQLKGKVAIVTGGGSGIGRAIGVGLAGEGASVVVADIDSNSADAVAAELEELGSYALAATVDVSKSDQVDALVEAAVERFGRLDILIINFTKSLAQEVARYGITVNAIAPGVTDTPLWRGFRSDADIVEALESGRVGAPEDFVPLVIFLCSEAGGIHCGIMVDRDIYVSRGER